MFERQDQSPKGLRTTTVRLDVDLWDEVDAELRRTGMARAEYIRIAVREKVLADRYRRLEVQMRQHRAETGVRLARIERILWRRLVRR